jgi:TM2 domain-containing membrane protein YozV
MNGAVPERSIWAYIGLYLLCGSGGAHSFYAGDRDKGARQLLAFALVVLMLVLQFRLGIVLYLLLQIWVLFDVVMTLSTEGWNRPGQGEPVTI